MENPYVAQQPIIYSTDQCYDGKACRVTWRFTVKNQIFGIPQPQEYVFYCRVYPVHSHLCLGASCTTTRWNKAARVTLHKAAVAFGVSLVLLFALAGLWITLQTIVDGA